MHRQLLTILLLLSCLNIQKSVAVTNSWKVIPTTCLVKERGDVCNLKLTIEVPQELLGNSATEVCFALEDIILSCAQSTSEYIEVDVEFNKEQRFSVLLAGKTAYETKLIIQTTSPIVKKRRVRNPWSLF
ncbi:MAG: DUF3019 domain-containing protein [Alteromonadaceae bacterium]|nr:DUF3019 domain-containing protein [Alteromonadaceae bacterium]